jgi:hypothetical protein
VAADVGVCGGASGRPGASGDVAGAGAERRGDHGGWVRRPRAKRLLAPLDGDAALGANAVPRARAVRSHVLHGARQSRRPWWGEALGGGGKDVGIQSTYLRLQNQHFTCVQEAAFSHLGEKGLLREGVSVFRFLYFLGPGFRVWWCNVRVCHDSLNALLELFSAAISSRGTTRGWAGRRRRRS